MTAVETTEDHTLAGTAALTLLTVAVGLGFGRVFAGADWVLPIIAVAVTTHALAWWCRQRRFPTSAAAALVVLVDAALIVWLVLPHLTTYGWPTWRTVKAVGDALTLARTDFGQAVAPVPVTPGYIIATAVGVAIAAFMGDWAAFRIRAPFEACVPAFTLFLFTAALGADAHQTLSVVAFVTTVLAFLLTHQIARHNRAGSWFGGRAGDGSAALARVAAGFAVVAVLAGLIIGPALPGAGADPVVPYRGKVPTGPTNRATVSPLVDIRGRLVEQAGIEVFSVRADQPGYWRLTALDEFDGQIWRSEDNYRTTKGRIQVQIGPDAGVKTTEVRQEYSITGLASIWVPAAYQPTSVSGLPGTSYAPESASVITPQDTSDGLEYTVTSRVADLSADALRRAPAIAPQAVIDKYLSLPPISNRVKAFAAQLVRGRATPYDQALALQSFFRDNYTYDLGAAAGHDARTIERFLFNARRGYCEQFAGTYAVLARAVGLPARVAVGFTQGVLDADGRFHVFDEHAHAWPEVYLHGFGWVAFEPTPGRGAPGAEDYTGVPAAQDTRGASTAPTTAAPPTTADPNQQSPETAAPDPLAGQDPTVVSGDRSTPLTRQPGWIVVFVALTLGGLWLVVVPALHLAHQTRRRQRAENAGPRESVIASWEDTHDALNRAGVGRGAAETLPEYARRAAGGAGLSSEEAVAFRRLAASTSTATFSIADVDNVDAIAARHDASTVVARVQSQLSAGDKLRAALDPRPLLRAWRASRPAGDAAQPTGRSRSASA